MVMVFGNIPLCQPVIFDPIDIAESLKQLNGNKYIGSDNIHPYVLKQCSLSFSYPYVYSFKFHSTLESSLHLGNWQTLLQFIKVVVDYLLTIIVVSPYYQCYAKLWREL